MNQLEVAQATEKLEAAGYVVLRRKSHDHTLMQLAIARRNVQFEKGCAEHTRRWCTENLNRERQLSDRCSFLYAKALAAGVPLEELS